MEKTLVATGKTIELAIESALTQLGLDRDSVSVQVLAQAKSGFLGFGAQPAKVQVTYEAPDPAPQAPKSALSSASRSKPKAAAPVQKPQVPQQEVPKQEVKKPEAPKPAKPEAPKPPKAPKEPKVETPKTPQPPREFVPAAPGSVEEKIEVFLKGLLEHMGSQAVPHAWKDGEDSYRVELTGEDLGYLIGRRGDTLDALQHLCNYSVNRSVDGHIRISVDAEDYRQKREESLRRYARKKAQQVLKARRRTTLEPMNAYERHLVHATLQDMDRITTHSVGTEPNRRVVIEYVR
ncbi:MAG TPA: protein jag [Candidatus Faecousia excrementigallinarum]|uniref:RNA-binding protein KhpB n=1 Tax=Candidatus Faecousia excrementigallinarum TaxID=2840806 RepID=A0A9D0Z2F6_9FIRM|nr:protein jag [Candidatus Faecousia excrementigallinarum]